MPKTIKIAHVKKGVELKRVSKLNRENFENFLSLAQEELRVVVGDINDLMRLEHTTFALEHDPQPTIHGKDYDTEHGYCDFVFSNIFNAESHWRATVAVSREDAFAHEWGHYLMHLWQELCSDGRSEGVKFADFVCTYPAMWKLIKIGLELDKEVVDDDYLSDPREIFARMFETYISYRAGYRFEGYTLESCHSYELLSQGYYDQEGNHYYLVGYGFAAEWLEIDARFHRAILRIQRDIRSTIAAQPAEGD
jgi:hypothetical protein